MASAVNGKKSRKEERSLARLCARETRFHRDSCLPADCGGKGSGTEHAALYHLEVWSEVYLAGKFVLWLLVEFISRKMDQLNFPISSMEVAKGMTSEVVQLRERSSGKLVHTGWLRGFRATGKVIYAGFYSTAQVPGESNPCVKVTFPCYGSSSVYLRPYLYEDGSFGLASTGAGFGKSGFYRIVEAGPEAWKVRAFTTLHEIFHVYVDEEGVLRTDHEIRFVGLTVLRLHYKMTVTSPLPEGDGFSTHGSITAPPLTVEGSVRA